MKNNIKGMSEINLDDYISQLEEIQKNGYNETKTGFHLLDAKFSAGGLTEGQLIILAARPSMGKSVFAQNLAENIGKQKTVLFFSLEMTYKEIVDRIVCHKADIDMCKLKQKGGMKTNEFARFVSIIPELKETLLHITDASYQTVDTIKKITTEYLEEIKTSNLETGLIVIDHLSLISTKNSKAATKNDMVGEITGALKAFAKDIGIPILLISQLNRNSTSRVNNKPQLSDLRDSGSIEQDADIVLALHREEIYNDKPDLKGLAELLILKNRDGELGNIMMKFNGNRFNFSENYNENISDAESLKPQIKETSSTSSTSYKTEPYPF
jgi:replicative DNA helicase